MLVIKIIKTKMEKTGLALLPKLLKDYLRYILKLLLIFFILSCLVIYCSVKWQLEDECLEETEFSATVKCGKLIGRNK